MTLKRFFIFFRFVFFTRGPRLLGLPVLSVDTVFDRFDISLDICGQSCDPAIFLVSSLGWFLGK